ANALRDAPTVPANKFFVHPDGKERAFRNLRQHPSFDSKAWTGAEVQIGRGRDPDVSCTDQKGLTDNSSAVGHRRDGNTIIAVHAVERVSLSSPPGDKIGRRRHTKR